MSNTEKKKENIFVRILRYLFPWKGDSAKEVVRKIVFLVAVVALVVSGSYFVTRYLHRNDYKHLSDNSAQVDWSNTSKEDESLDRYEKLKSINKDFCGWLKIEGTGIDVPLVQCEDNDKYLKTSFYGKSSQYGNPFVDHRNNLKKFDRNTVIYGHNMKDNMVFAELTQYKDPDFLKNHPIIYLGTLYDDTYWKVCSVFITNAMKGDDNGYYFEYNFVNCKDDNFDSYAKELKKRSIVNTGVDVKQGDKLLTLSTCVYDFREARLAVVARQVREDELKKIDTSKVTKNNNPKYPQGYCDAKGIKNQFKNDKQWSPYKQ